MPRCSRISNSGIQYTPVDSSATVVTPHCSSQSVKRSRSSVKVQILAPVSRPALEVRLQTFLVHQRRYRMHSAPTPAGPPNTSPCFVSSAWISRSAAADYRFVSCSLGPGFLSCKQRPSCAIEGTLPNGISWVAPLLTTALRTELGATLIYRCLTTHHCQDGLLPLPVAPSQDAETG